MLNALSGSALTAGLLPRQNLSPFSDDKFNAFQPKAPENAGPEKTPTLFPQIEDVVSISLEAKTTASFSQTQQRGFGQFATQTNLSVNSSLSARIELADGSLITLDINLLYESTSLSTGRGNGRAFSEKSAEFAVQAYQDAARSALAAIGIDSGFIADTL
ncbi:MAG: hypothetical protein VKL39_05165, partial [Leptolyngbyaceae bacterium]|nr:hypothetical protein [Leptolyngbyaceae bacterium]